jgi:uncharacterized membrane protein
LGKFLSESNTITGSTKKYISINYLLLIIILICGAYFRFRKLTFQSLWLDELTTMIDANPKLSWTEFIHTVIREEIVAPPFFFVVERYFAIFFGYNDWVARSVSACSGVGCIWAIYLLGKEIKDEKLGIVAAAITCVNYFNIMYSQEARVYAFLWLFTTLS